MILDLFKKKGSGLDAASREVLEQALGQRSKMEMVFEDDSTSIKGLDCAINTIGQDAIYLDVYGINKPGNFSGRAITCFFRIREGKAAVGFYAFRTTVQSVRQTKSGGIVFIVSVPSRVERSQRRRSMRVRPDLGWFEKLHFWRGLKRAATEADRILLGLPELKQGKVVRLENLSAGGVGLHFSREFCQQSQFCPSKGDEFTLHIRFAQEARNQPREVWLTGRAVRALEDRVTRDVSVGVEFNHVGRGDPAGGEMNWAPIQENVAEELMTRVFEWHSAMARDRAGMDS
jgi:hypothetical protein